MWQSSTLSTTPPAFEMAATAVVAPGLDFANALSGGENFTTATATLRNLGTNTVVSVTPSVNGNIATVVLDGTARGFKRGETYELVIVANVSATKKPARVLIVKVVA